jgi:hypothetical protein
MGAADNPELQEAATGMATLAKALQEKQKAEAEAAKQQKPSLPLDEQLARHVRVLNGKRQRLARAEAAKDKAEAALTAAQEALSAANTRLTAAKEALQTEEIRHKELVQQLHLQQKDDTPSDSDSGPRRGGTRAASSPGKRDRTTRHDGRSATLDNVVGKQVLDLLDELYTSHHTHGDVSARVAEKAGELRDKLRQAAKATTDEDEDGASSEGSDKGESARLAKKKKQQTVLPPSATPGLSSASRVVDVQMS